MIADHDRFIIITGGPGSGKTTLIEALARQGHARTVEAGRAIIQDQVAIGGQALPWRDPAAFAEHMLAWEMRSHHMARRESGLVFFDRGVPEIGGYFALCGLPVPAHVENAVALFRYHVSVFVTPPWPEIYAQDSERKQDFDEAVRTYEAVIAAYARHGYELVELPRATAEARAQFILDRVGAH